MTDPRDPKKPLGPSEESADDSVPKVARRRLLQGMAAVGVAVGCGSEQSQSSAGVGGSGNQGSGGFGGGGSGGFGGRPGRVEAAARPTPARITPG